MWAGFDHGQSNQVPSSAVEAVLCNDKPFSNGSGGKSSPASAKKDTVLVKEVHSFKAQLAYTVAIYCNYAELHA